MMFLRGSLLFPVMTLLAGMGSSAHGADGLETLKKTIALQQAKIQELEDKMASSAVQDGKRFGQIVVNEGARAFNLPSKEFVEAHLDKTFVWSGPAPDLVRSERCTNPGALSFRKAPETDWMTGRYEMSFVKNPNGYLILDGSWYGWKAVLQVGEQELASGVGKVDFTLRFLDGRWVLEHMMARVNDVERFCF